MVAGHMCCGVAKDELMFRVGPERYAAALREPHARPCNFTGRPLKGLVLVAPEIIRSKKETAKWLGWSQQFVDSLPPK